jgi:hypothetical protein
VTLYYANASGDWDDEDIWNTAADDSGSDYTAGGSESGNTFDANNYTIEINATVTCDVITNAEKGTGGFTCDLDSGTNRVFTCKVAPDATACLVPSGSSYTLTTGDGTATAVTGGSAANAFGVDRTAVAALTISGGCVGGDNATGWALSRGPSAHTLTVTGDVAASSTAAAMQAGYRGVLTLGGDLTAEDDVAAIRDYSSYYTVILSGAKVCSAVGTDPLAAGAAGVRLKLAEAATQTMSFRDGSLDEQTFALQGAGGGGGLLVHPGMGGGMRG